MRLLVNLEPRLMFPRLFWARCYATKRSSSSTKWLNRANKDPYTKAARFNEYKSRAAFKLVQLDNKYNILKPGASVVDLGFAPGAWSQVAVARTKPHGIVLGVDIIPTSPPKGASSIQANILSIKTHKIIRSFFLEHQDNLKEKELEADALDKPSYIASELAENDYDEVDQESKLPINQKFPIDAVISDMYAPVPLPHMSWNNLTNSAFIRMANTSGLAVRDHNASIVCTIFLNEPIRSALLTELQNLCDAALILAIDLLKPGGAFICKFYTGPHDAGLEYRLRKCFTKVFRDKPDACRPESKECYFIGLGKLKDIDKNEVFG